MLAFGPNFFLRGVRSGSGQECHWCKKSATLSFRHVLLKANDNSVAIIEMDREITNCTTEGKYQFLVHRLCSKQQKEPVLK